MVFLLSFHAMFAGKAEHEEKPHALLRPLYHIKEGKLFSTLSLIFKVPL